MGAVADEQPGRVYAAFIQVVDFFIQHGGIDNDTVADNRSGLFVENTRRRETQLKYAVRIDHCVAGIISAGKAYYILGFFRQHINEFSFTFVSPLGPDYSNNRHFYLLEQNPYILPSRAWVVYLIYNSNEKN